MHETESPLDDVLEGRTLVDRSQLSNHVGLNELSGWVSVSADLGLLLPLTRTALVEIRDMTAETLATAGVGADDRVVVALNSDGAGLGVAWSEAVSLIADCCCTGPVQSSARLGRVLSALQATTLITNPTTAGRLLRHLRQSGQDPEQLGLRRLLLTGEIRRPDDIRRLARAFGSEPGEVWSDPVFGIALATRNETADILDYQPTRSGLVRCIPLRPWNRSGSILGEWVVIPRWTSTLDRWAIRTGVVGLGRTAAHPRPQWTVGAHLLVRGRWLDMESLQLRMADSAPGLHWTFVVTRGVGSERATMVVDATTDDEVAGVRAILADWSPIRIGTEHVTPHTLPHAAVVDRRRQHLGPRIELA